VDKAALQATTGSSATGDILLSMALWKAVSDRYELLLATWNSGSVGATELTRMATLIWGRLDASTASGLSVSLPEACRLSDALLSQLRVKLGLDPSGMEITERIRQLRAQMERIREQIDLEPAGAAQQQAALEQSRLARRLKELAEKASRGGDVAGMLGPMEIDAATFERDLIVNGARRRDAAALVQRARDQRADLEAREAALRSIVEECVRRVDPAPRYAVPDTAALGPVPNTLDQLENYLRRLDQVSRAMTVAQTAYAKALQDHEELASRLDAYHAKAVATGVAVVPDVAQAYELARNELDQRPSRMVLASQLVTVYQTYLQTTPAPHAVHPAVSSEST
jgi:DNA repair exonuclease SbcCD ATPase subunit